MSTFEIIRKTHFVVVTIFFLIYLIKTILLLANKKENLQSFTKKIKVIEMIVSFLFLGTGIYLMTQMPEIKMSLIIKISMVLFSIPLAVIGFKKGNKGMAVASFLLILGAFGIAEMNKHGGTKAKAPVDSLNSDGSINGEVLYKANCESCHGMDGKKNLAGAFDLSVTKLSSDSIDKIIQHGRGGMAKFDGLTPENRDAIAKYVESNIKGK
jgi:mono/diheme cytochrome c family protein